MRAIVWFIFTNMCLCVFIAMPCLATERPDMEKLFKEGDKLLASGKPQEAILTWKKIWDLDAKDLEGIKQQLDVYERFARAYESMGHEGLLAAVEYLRTEIHYRVPELQAPYQLRLGDALWKLNKRRDAAQEYSQALNSNPNLPDAQIIKNKILEGIKSPPVPPDVAGTIVYEPWPTPIECINPSNKMIYRWNASGTPQIICSVINEYGREDGYWFPRGSFRGDANLSIKVEGAQENEPYKKDDLPVTVYHHNGKQWRRILHTRAHSLTYIPNKEKGFPDIEVKWDSRGTEISFDESLDDTRDHLTRYVWNGKRYRDRGLDQALRLNTQALSLFANGKRTSATTLWKKAIRLAQVPGLGLISEAEILNNLGYACISEHCEAEKYLGFALRVNPYRWQAQLNLGDFHWNNGQKEKGIEFYSKVLEYNPTYRDSSKLVERIETTRQAVASLHEVPTNNIEIKDGGHEVTSIIAPYAEKMAKANGLDLNKMINALGIKEDSTPNQDHSVYITPGRGSYLTSRTVKIYELLRARMMNLPRDVYFILYNVNPIPGWEEEQAEYVKGWRLAELNDDYSLSAVHDLKAQSECKWPDYSHKQTNMYVEAGELNVVVLNAEVGRYTSSPGGSSYTFLPDKKHLFLKKVTCVESEPRGDEEEE